MTASMISFTTGEWRFHLRAAAIVRNGDFVLLHRMADGPFWALPGTMTPRNHNKAPRSLCWMHR
jgi:hypothetical protein